LSQQAAKVHENLLEDQLKSFLLRDDRDSHFMLQGVSPDVFENIYAKAHDLTSHFPGFEGARQVDFL